MLTLAGFEISTSVLLTITVEDWSRVRSPGRARRRRAQGHRQNIAFVTRPDPKIVAYRDPVTGSHRAVAHPDTLAELRRTLALQGASI